MTMSVVVAPASVVVYIVPLLAQTLWVISTEAIVILIIDDALRHLWLIFPVSVLDYLFA